MDIELPFDFKEFLKLLNENGVRYLISGVEFEECYASQIEDDIDGVKTNIIDLSHLKANKRAAGRLKDLADLENLP